MKMPTTLMIPLSNSRMRRAGFSQIYSSGTPLFLFALCCSLSVAHADLIEMQNGDRYAGKLVGVNDTNITWRSDILGEMQLPRAKISAITFGEKAQTAKPVAAATVQPPSARKTQPQDPLTQIRDVGIDPQAIKQVQEQILGSASPEATKQFNDMVAGLATGSLNLKDIRAQAQNSVRELEAAKQELGEDFGMALDGYLGILQRFLSETAQPSKPAVRSLVPTQPPPKVSSDEDE
jgi:hypothetical protein